MRNADQVMQEIRDASAKAGFHAGWNAAMEEAAAVVSADLHYTTMELTAMRGDKKVPHHRIAQGSPEHAEALRGLIRPQPLI